MQGVKNFFASKTIWTGILVFVLSVLAYFKVQVPGLSADALEENLLPIGGIVGGILTIVFRTLATKKVEVLPKDDDSLQNMALAVMLGLGVIGMGGCSLFVSPTPMTEQDVAIQQVSRAQAAYTVAITSVNVMHAQGKISKEQMKIIAPLEQTAFAYLQAATDAAYQGKTVDAAKQQKLFYEALARFSAAYAPAAPNTPPVVVIPSAPASMPATP